MTKPSSRKGRFVRHTFRWTCRLLVLLILALLVCAIYLDRAGLPEFIKQRLVANLRARGWDIEFSSLRFHWRRGMVVQNLQLQRAHGKPGPVIFVEDATCQVNHRALRNLDLEVDSVLLQGGAVVWQFAETNAPTATFRLDKIGGELIFEPNDLWRLRSLNAEVLGTSLNISGTLTNASRVRDWKFPKETTPSEATQALWRKIVSRAGQVKFTGQPELLTRFQGDARDLRKLDADLKFAAPAVQTPWGAATNPVLHVRVLPAQIDEPLQADLELSAEQTTTHWGEARRVRLNWQIEPPLASLFPSNAHVTVDLLAPETTWAKARHVTANVYLVPEPIESGQFRTRVRAAIEQLQSRWGESDFVDLNGSVQHAATNPLPATVSAELRVSKARSEWGEALGAIISASATLPAREQFQMFQTNLTWPERLSNVVFASSVTASNVSSEKVRVASGVLNTRFDSQQLNLDTSLDLYGGTLTATARVDAATREAVFAARANVDPYDVTELLTPAARAWLTNYTWKAAPLLSVAGAVTLPAWTNRHPDWKTEVRPALSVAGRFDVGEGAYREATYTSASSPFTLTNLLWRIPELVVVRPEGTLHGEYSTELATRDFRWKFQGPIDPRVVRPFLTKESQRKVFDDFQFSQPAFIMGEVWNRWGDAERLGVNMRIAATNFVFRGERISEVTTDLTYSNKFLTFAGPIIRQGQEEGRAPMVLIDIASQRLYLTNAIGNLNPYAISRVIGEKPAEAIAPYQFAVSPASRVNGVVDLKKGRHEDDLHFEIRGGAFRWRKFHLQRLSGNVDWVGDKVSLNNLSGSFSNGTIAGAAAFDFARGDSATFAFNLGLTEADLRTTMPEIGFPTNKIEGFLSGELFIRSANTTNRNSWQGEGKLHLRDGLIWDIPMFGVFSPILNTVVPGLGNSRAKDAQATFVITNSVIVSHDLEIHATAMRMGFDGAVNFAGAVDGRMEAELLRDVPAIGIVISKVLWPITKIFEYKVTGAVDHPQTEPLYLVPKILLLPFQPLKMLQSMFPDTSKPPPPSPDGSKPPPKP